MNTFKKIIKISLVTLLICIPLSATFASFYPTAGQNYNTRTWIGTTDSVIYLSSFLEPGSNMPYTMSYLNSNIEYGTLDPQFPGRTETISFTGIVQNSDGSATLTGVTRGLTGSYPYTSSTTLSVTHGPQATFVLSDSPQVFAQYPGKQNNETVTGSWSFPTPTSSSNPATMGYVLGLSLGSTTVDRVVVAGNASGTIATSSIVFYNSSNAEWALSNAGTSTDIYNVILGIAQGSGTNGVAINGGVLVKGLDHTQTGLSAGKMYFISSTTAGSITTATTSSAIGMAQSTTGLYFDPYFFNATFSGDNNAFTGNNTFSGTTTFTSATSSITVATTSLVIGSTPVFSIGKNYLIATSTGTTTFTFPQGVSNFTIQVQGAGANGGTGTSGTTCGGGGSAGAYAFWAGTISGTTTATLVVGTIGGNTSFTTNGLTITAPPGTVGASNAVSAVGGVGTIATGGLFNEIGGDGGNCLMTGSNAGIGGGQGGASFFGGGGHGSSSSGSGGSPGGPYGSGGGGGADTGGPGAGQTGAVIISW